MYRMLPNNTRNSMHRITSNLYYDVYHSRKDMNIIITSLFKPRVNEYELKKYYELI